MADLSVYVIAGPWPPRGRSALDVARAALLGGAPAVQFRDKQAPDGELLRQATVIRELTRQAGAMFIINDRPDIARAVDADGVHVGPEDMSVTEARRLLGPAALIGASVETVAEARAAESAGASYLGVGPVFATTTKLDAGQPVGCQRVAEIKSAVNIPVVAIGGITAGTAGEVVRAGADGVAVTAAVADADDMSLAVERLLAQVEEVRSRSVCQP